ncbi:MAG: Xaa-Pro aminopeptidase [Kiritimatiellia bacterium]|jgi:Xaa-Pro aminopeptidase
MIAAETHRSRREHLRSLVQGPILLLGTDHRARNLPMNALPFRQDSTFLYYTGCTESGAFALLDDDGCTLFLPPKSPDDALWHGPTPSLEDIRDRLDVERIVSAKTLDRVIAGRSPATLAIGDENVNRRISDLLNVPLRFGRQHGDERLVDAVISMRRAKSEEELVQMRLSADATEAAHRAVMTATRPGTSERILAALFEGVLAARGCVPGYGTILTVHGEVLHNFDHNNVLKDGELLLLDGGGEVPSGYGSDVTRTWPVNGRFSGRQRAAYEAVLEAEVQAIAQCRPNNRYRLVHDAACTVIAQFLIDEGLLTCSVQTALETGAHGVFFPHGTGHLLGMDVHDLENFGDRPSYPADRQRPAQFGTRYLRLDLPLEPGWVVTVEPGFYVVPAILNDSKLRESFSGLVDFHRAESWMGFGGIRIEDDVCVTDEEPENLTGVIPKQVAVLESLIGSGPPAEVRLC